MPVSESNGNRMILFKLCFKRLQLDSDKAIVYHSNLIKRSREMAMSLRVNYTIVQLDLQSDDETLAIKL